MEMTNLVNFEVFGTDFSVEVVGELTEQQVRDHVTTKMAKEFVETFRIKSINQVLDRKPRRSLFDTYADGFRVFAQKFVAAQ